MFNRVFLRTRLADGCAPLRKSILRISSAKFSGQTSELALLEQLLAAAKQRQEASASEPKKKVPLGRFQIKTMNAISPKGLTAFHEDYYHVTPEDSEFTDGGPHALLLRSHKLKKEEVSRSVRAIARCGAGVNNIPVDEMTARGIPVFNTPGANANAVKELVVCGMLLASRGIVQGINHTKNVIYPEVENDHEAAAARIESDKKLFVGQELKGKTLGVVGLGHIGGLVVEAALALGMKVVGFDPTLTLDAAFRLPGDRMIRAPSLNALISEADYCTLHVPYMPATHHLLGQEQFNLMKNNLHLLNFSRAELVDSNALATMYNQGHLKGMYICDFADRFLYADPHMMMLPHLGASTAEAEESAAAMASAQIIKFLTTGAIKNSVNFPDVPELAETGPDQLTSCRLCIVNKNSPGVLGAITTFLGEHKLNISQQFNRSRGDIAYTVVDLEATPENPAEIQEHLGTLDGVLSSRYIGDPFHDEMGQPGTFYSVYYKDEK